MFVDTNSEVAFGGLAGAIGPNVILSHYKVCFLARSVSKLSAFRSTFQMRAFERLESKVLRCVVLGDASRD